MTKKPTLAQLAGRANRHHARVLGAMRNALDHARHAGDALRAAKKLVGHGNWTEWLGHHFRGSPETARAYMRVARNWRSLEPLLGREGGFKLADALECLRVRPDREPDWQPERTSKQEFAREYLERSRVGLRHHLLGNVSRLDDYLLIFFGRGSPILISDTGIDEFWDRLVAEARPLADVFAEAYLSLEYDSRQLNAEPLTEEERERQLEGLHERYRAELRPLLDRPDLTDWQRARVRELLGLAAGPPGEGEAGPRAGDNRGEPRPGGRHGAGN
jgi:hypothetical protein